ncbi:hypothetical protein [Luteimonas sp. A649]
MTTLAALLTACEPAVPAETFGAPGDLAYADIPTSPLAWKDDAVEWFAVEKAMGAECGSGAITDPPLGDTACAGQLPEHLAWFLRNIPEGHPFLTDVERDEAARARQNFKAVRGLGQRPDFVATIHHFSPFWLRSFEGPDPDTTVYLVYGPRCDGLWRNPDDPFEDKCHPDHTYLREFRIYRVRKGGAPEDVTRELAPLAPNLAPAEHRRYGRYLDREDDALDADVQMDVTRLVYVPVLRWVLRAVQEGDYDPPPMPASDPRAFEDQDWRDHSAHFGFLVWTGERFELRETVPPALWPCRTVRSSGHVCVTGYDKHADRYLDHIESLEQGRTSP